MSKWTTIIVIVLVAIIGSFVSTAFANYIAHDNHDNLTLANAILEYRNYVDAACLISSVFIAIFMK